MKKLFSLLIMVWFVGAMEVHAQACASPHTTMMNYNNGQDGNMFDITALTDVTIDSFWCNFDAGTVQEVEIWYRTNTVVGNQASSAGWIKIDSVLNLPSAGLNNYTHVPIHVNIFIPAGSTYGFYVTRAYLPNVGPYMRYTNGPGGSSAGQLYNQNANIQVSYAYGKDYPFGATFNPRIWNGRIFYSCCPDPPSPQLSAAPTQICANDTFTYSAQPYAFSNGFSWNFGSSGTIVGANNDSSTVQVVFNGNVVFDTVCLTMYDTCSDADTCFPIVINPPAADAGPDTSICSTTFQLQGNAGSGLWEVVGGAGTFVDPTVYNTMVSGLAPGVNTFRWSVGNAQCDTVFDEVNVTVNPIPVAQYNTPYGCADNQIQFIDNSYALGGNIISWQWDVNGDGTMDYTTNNFAHSYSTPATYQCTLVVTANQGCTDTLVKDIVVSPNPAVNFSYDPDCEGSPMTFTDLTTISSGSLASWVWQFGDGSNPSYAQNPAHVYPVDGWYVVTLTVTSDSNCAVSFEDSVEVFSIPIVQFESPEVCRNDTVWFSDSSISTQGIINYWEWDFGDGWPIDYNQHTAHMYVNHGLYNVRLTVATDKGCTNTVVVPHRSFPVPVPDYIQDGLCEQQRVTFTDNSQLDPQFGSVLVDWHWEFGDSADAHNEQVGHFYQEPGYYTMKLTPYTNYGCHHTYESEILMRPKPEAKILILDDKVCALNEISYRDETYFDYEFDSIGVISWNWLFGDGASSLKRHPKHTFQKGGTFNTLLITETTYGCIDSAFRNTVVYHLPDADFRIDSIEGCSPHCVTFIDESKLADSDTLLYHWVFGDGSTNNEDVNPTYCYGVTDGTGIQKFDVTLDVTTLHGCSDTFTHSERVIIHANPISDFDLSSENVSLLDPKVLVDNYSIGADYWLWDFGDSTTSVFANPLKHEYAEPGTYTVRLTTTTEFGCEDVLEKTITVERHQTLYIPTSFSPNGDEVNDWFEIKGEDLESVKLWIYDRWGGLLFYGENDNARWDGRMDGTMLPMGSYAYVVEFKQVNQVREKRTGNFVIARSDQK
jgi:gliding motility-associated-like protein